MRRLLAAVMVSLAASSSWAGWWDLHRADRDFDLAQARAAALATVAEDPSGADGVGAALWWLESLNHVPDPSEILVFDEVRQDPELGFLLARIEAEIQGRPPEGSLAPAELAGPFGVFEDLDLERDVVPSDQDLPELETPWTQPWSPYRLRLLTPAGTVSPPESLDAGGVSLAAWTFRLERRFEGWMVVEGRGGLNIELNGGPLARLRRCGQEDAEVTWFRVDLEQGKHRLRIVMGSRETPRARVSLFDDQGHPVSAEVLPMAEGPWAASTAERRLPPASAALEAMIEAGGATIPDLLLAAELAAGRGDPRSQRDWIERAVDLAPSDPWPRLAMAWFYLIEDTGADPETDYQKAREELRHASEIPASKLAERALALREQRPEDWERILDEVVESAGDDVRVKQLWVREALRRGWASEVEAGVASLSAELPESQSVMDLRLSALEALELWEDRRDLLRSVAATDPVRLQWIEELASGCMVDDAVAALDRIEERVDDPSMDLARIRLLIGTGDLDRARRELDRAQLRWGASPATDQLRLVLEAGDDRALEAALAASLERDPSNLQFRTLSWSRGVVPFYEPFRVTLDEVREAQFEAGDGVDVMLLLDQAVERVYSDGSALYYYHGVSHAVTPVGARQASTLQQMPDAFLIKIRIIKPDGRIVVPAQMEARNGSLVLGDVTPGDMVEEEYVAAVRPTGASRRGHMSPYIYRFADEDRAFGRSEYLLLVPPDIDLKMDGNFDGLEREDFEHEGLRAIRWLNEDVPPVLREPLAPPTQELLPWVSYSFGVTWQDVGDIVRDRALSAFITTPELDEWSAPLLAEPDAEEAIRRLVRGVLDEVAPGRRAMDLSVTAGQSFARREGNRVGIVAAALLDAGWTVELIMARPEPLARKHLDVPTLETFGEPLLRVSRGESRIWIDLEERLAGIDHIRPIYQRGDGLVLAMSEPGQPVEYIEELPSFPNPSFGQRVELTAEIDSRGGARVEFEMPLEGSDGERLMREITSLPAERVQQLYLQMANNLFPGASEVSGSVERGAETLLRLELRLPSACEISGTSMVCRSLVVARPLVPALASLPARSYPLDLRLPITERVTTEIEPPPGWTVDRTPRRLQSSWGSLTEELSVENGRYRSVVELEVPSRTVSPDDYPAFARFCHAVDELNSRPPTFVPIR